MWRLLSHRNLDIVCTFENEISNSNCEICNTIAPAPPSPESLVSKLQRLPSTPIAIRQTSTHNKNNSNNNNNSVTTTDPVGNTSSSSAAVNDADTNSDASALKPALPQWNKFRHSANISSLNESRLNSLPSYTTQSSATASVTSPSNKTPPALPTTPMPTNKPTVPVQTDNIIQTKHSLNTNDSTTSTITAQNNNNILAAEIECNVHVESPHHDTAVNSAVNSADITNVDVTNSNSVESRHTESLRNKVLSEIVSSEQHYVDALVELITNYMEPIKHDAGKLGVTNKQISAMFSNISVLVQFHAILLGDLKRSNCIVQVFVQSADFLKMYTQYLNFYERAIATINSMVVVLLLLTSAGINCNVSRLTHPFI